MRSASTLLALCLGTPPGAGIARVGGGVGGFLMIVAGPFLIPDSVAQVGGFILLGLVWLGSVFLGVNSLAISSYRLYGLSRPYQWRPSWTRSVWSGLLASSLTAVVLLPQESWAAAFLSLGIATNVAYAGAKGGCCRVGCCQSHRPLPLTGALLQNLPTWEMCAAVMTATFATGYVLVGGHPTASGMIAFVGHAVVRGFAGWLRFPTRTAWSFVGDVGAGGLTAIATGVGFLLR